MFLLLVLDSGSVVLIDNKFLHSELCVLFHQQLNLEHRYFLSLRNLATLGNSAKQDYD